MAKLLAIIPDLIFSTKVFSTARSLGVDIVGARTPEVIAQRLDAHGAVSWADTARDLSAWMENAMQTSTLQELYKLEPAILAKGDPQLLEDFRKLTTSDHVYYMSTKHLGDGDVHAYFNPYDSPYDAYIYMMNVMDNLRSRIRTG